MHVDVLYVTDPVCPWSWGAEPTLRRLECEFGDDVRITYLMAGLWREVDRPLEAMRAWLDAADASGMPVDPRGWADAPPRSSYPACLAVKAAAEQKLDGPYLRRVREAVACERSRADNPETLTALAREVPSMNVERFEIDLRSNAIVEAFGADLERVRELGAETPAFAVGGDVVGPDAVRDAVAAAGASAQPLPTAEEALRRYPRMAAPEVAAACDLPGPRAPAELWRLALEWRARPTRYLTGELWSSA